MLNFTSTVGGFCHRKVQQASPPHYSIAWRCNHSVVLKAYCSNNYYHCFVCLFVLKFSCIHLTDSEIGHTAQ